MVCRKEVHGEERNVRFLIQRTVYKCVYMTLQEPSLFTSRIPVNAFIYVHIYGVIEPAKEHQVLRECQLWLSYQDSLCGMHIDESHPADK